MKKMGINFCSFVEDKLFGLLSVRVSVCVNLLVVVVMVEVTRFEWLCVFCLFFYTSQNSIGSSLNFFDSDKSSGCSDASDSDVAFDDFDSDDDFGLDDNEPKSLSEDSGDFDVPTYLCQVVKK